MPKGSLLVIAFSVMLMAIFCTFSYLITTVNPPRIKPDTYRARKFGVEDVLYPNDAQQPNDNVVFGLEKADYDVIKAHHTFSTPTAAYRRAEIPRTVGKEKTVVTWSKNNVRNSSIQQDDESKTTQAMKLPVKGFRRSISDKTKVNDSYFLSLLLNLNKQDSHPRIEFEISNNNNANIFRKYKNEDTLKIKLNLTNGYNYNKTIIELKENEILTVKYIGNLIEIAKSFQTNSKDPYTDYNNEITTKISYSELENATDICNGNGCALNFLNNTVKSVSRSENVTSDFNITLQTNSSNNTSFTYDSTTPINSSRVFKMENLTNSISMNANELDESDIRPDSNDVNDRLSTKKLVGLLIPEARATLSVN